MLIRRALRLGSTGKVNPITGMYPYRSKEIGGWNIYPGQGPYSVFEALKGNQPYVGHRMRTEVEQGHVKTRTIDIDRHFSTQDRYDTVSYKDRFKLAAATLFSIRGWAYTIISSIVGVLFFRFLSYRREPSEIVMDRDTFFKNYDSFTNAIFFDHHRFHHMLNARRANKWGYHDVTMDGDHH